MPNSWTYEELGEICKVTSGGTPRRDEPSFWDGEIPWVTTAEIKGGVIKSSAERITQAGINGSSAKIFPTNTVLVAMYGQGKTRGMSGILGLDASTNQACAAILPSKKLNPQFLFQYLNGKYEYLRSLSNLGGQQNLSGGIIKSLVVPIPPAYEQTKIVEILSTWDKSIEATERLLENSKKRKKTLMQQLLTGKRRLPGFSGVWSKGTLNSVADVIVSPVDKRTIDGQPEVVLCNYMDVYRNNYITSSVEFMRATASEQEIARFSIRKGDVLITKDSESPDDIAVPALVDEELTGVVCGYHLAIIRPKEMELHGAYLSFLLTTPKVRHYFFTLANGATRFGLSVGAIQNAEFFLPPFNEQVQIARVLRISDDEQTFLSRRLSHLKSEKKALMQQLLTGKKRVNVEEGM